MTHKKKLIEALCRGKVRLLQRDELDADWEPTKDRRLTIWDILPAREGEL